MWVHTLPETVEPAGGGGGDQGSGGGSGSDQGPFASLGNSISSFGNTVAQALESERGGEGEGATNVRSSDDLPREFEEERRRLEPSSSVSGSSSSSLAIGKNTGSNVSNSSNVAAATLGLEGDLLGILSSSECVFITALIVALIFVVWGLLVLKNKRRYTHEILLRYRQTYFPLAFTTALAVAYIFNYICTVLPLLAVLVFSLIWVFWGGLKDTE